MDVTYGSICLRRKGAVNIPDMLAMAVVERVATLQVSIRDGLVRFIELSHDFPN